MSTDEAPKPPIEGLLDEEQLAEVLESGRFKRFLDHIPVAVAVAELQPSEKIVYVNREFERITGRTAAQVEGGSWAQFTALAAEDRDDRKLGDAIEHEDDYIGAFATQSGEQSIVFDAWSNTIENEDGTPMFRLVALVDGRRSVSEAGELEKKLREKDLLLRELQHRVKNNLQMITALIRLETRNVQEAASGARFERLAGRVEALALLYRSMSDGGDGEMVDLGVYLSQIASAVMQAHAVEGIRLDMKIDTWPVSVNVAMPTGLVVNELLINALKHAFVGREGGTITLHSLVDESGCMVTVADDGIGLSASATWPQSGKLGSLIVRSLEQNARARIAVQSAPGEGLSVSIRFARIHAAPERVGS